MTRIVLPVGRDRQAGAAIAVGAVGPDPAARRHVGQLVHARRLVAALRGDGPFAVPVGQPVIGRRRIGEPAAAPLGAGGHLRLGRGGRKRRSGLEHRRAPAWRCRRLPTVRFTRLAAWLIRLPSGDSSGGGATMGKTWPPLAAAALLMLPTAAAAQEATAPPSASAVAPAEAPIDPATIAMPDTRLHADAGDREQLRQVFHLQPRRHRLRDRVCGPAASATAMRAA